MNELTFRSPAAEWRAAQGLWRPACQLQARVRLAPVDLCRSAPRAQGGCLAARAEDADARAGPSAGERLNLSAGPHRILSWIPPDRSQSQPPNVCA